MAPPGRLSRHHEGTAGHSQVGWKLIILMTTLRGFLLRRGLSVLLPPRGVAPKGGLLLFLFFSLHHAFFLFLFSRLTATSTLFYGDPFCSRTVSPVLLAGLVASEH